LGEGCSGCNAGVVALHRRNMPCNGGNYFGRNDGHDLDLTILRQEIDVLTRRLCHACQLLEDAGVNIPSELDEFWNEHKLKDKELMEEAKRRAKAQESKDRRDEYLESVKDRVLGQLTDDEREALGL